MVGDICNIILHGGSNGVFFTNDIVTGSVILEFKKERKIEQIYLRVMGTSKANWTRPSPTMPYIKIYSERRKVLDITIDIFGELKGKMVKPGISTCHFHFILPEDLPSSYNDSIAKVYYEIAVQNKGSYIWQNKNKVPLIVMSHVNINHLNEYKIPMIYEAEKVFGKSKFSIKFKTYKGFASNQPISFEVFINNEKRIRVKKISVTLIQMIEYNVSSGFCDDKRAILKTTYDNILNIATQTCVFGMRVPQLIVSTLNQSEPMVNISYSLKVKVSFKCYLPLYCDIPVTIASVPVTHGIFYY